MTELVDVVQPLNKLLDMLIVFAFGIAIVSFVMVLLTLINIENKKLEYKKEKVKIIAYALLLVVAFSSFVFLLMKNESSIKDNDAAVAEAVDKNIVLLLSENQQKEKKKQLSVIEIEAYITFNMDYFLEKKFQTDIFSKSRKLKDIEKSIKKYVFNNYDKENILYQELILESKTMFD